MVARFTFRYPQIIFLLIVEITTTIIPCGAQLQRGNFEHISIDQGLAQADINCIFQDSKGFVWMGGYAGLYRYDGYEMIAFYRDPDDPKSIIDNRVNDIVEDKMSNLWIATQDGLSYFNRKTEQFTGFPKDQLSSNLLFKIYLDSAGQLWIMTREGLDLYDTNNKKITYLNQDTLSFPNLKGVYVYEVFEDQAKRCWIGTDKGLMLFDRKKQSFTTVLLNFGKPNNGSFQPEISDITQDKQGNLWLSSANGIIYYNVVTKVSRNFLLAPEGDAGNYCSRILTTDNNKYIWVATADGLVQFDPKNSSFIRMKNDPNDPFSLNHNSVYCMMEDKSGLLWSGTLVGVNKFNPSWEQFKKYPFNLNEFINDATAFPSFHEITPGALLMQGKNGLEVLDVKKHTTTAFPYKPSFDVEDWNTGVTCYLEDDKNRLWIGTADGGVFIMDKKKKTFVHFKSVRTDSTTLSCDNIREIFKDSKGNIWLVHIYWGVSRFDEKTKTFIRYIDNYPNRLHEARTIYEDHLGYIWIGTRGGLVQLDLAKNKINIYSQNPNDLNSISENTAFDIYEDESKDLWIGTYGGGLNKFDRKTKSFTHYTTKDGLPDNNVFSVFPDARGDLWLSTFACIVKFDPKTEKFRTYDYREGLLNKGYGAFMYYRMPSSGELVFAGLQGLDIFQPDSIKVDSTLPSVVITDLLLFNKSVPVKSKELKEQKATYYLPQSITETKEITLPYRMKVITFKFAALHFANPSKNQYAYWLKGFDENWQYVGANRTATYTNLKPGHYTFRVKASNADGVWNEKGTAIELTILPPWWQTWWAYLLYVIGLTSVVWIIYNYQRKRWRLQTQLQMEQREAVRLKELDLFKSHLYANITHEFRTPLTVILGNADELSNKLAQTIPQSMLNLLSVIRRNGENLLRLINQMLDLSRLESGVMSVNRQQGDIIHYIKYLYESFESLARNKGIELHFHSTTPDLIMDYDADKILKIVSNLLSNAIKFTPAGGLVNLNLSVDNQIFVLQVEDNGIGIAPEKQAYIFDRFYQADPSSTRKTEGAGIGLALTKDLITLLKGSIEVQSTLGKGTLFTVRLPITNQASNENELLVNPVLTEDAPVVLNLESFNTNEKEHPLLLIVEDNIDVAQYIASCVMDSYKIIFSKNGKEGIEQALEGIPDIIISDVMMPEADGFELCETLKNDERTSHIPIILLTAKATVEDRITGLRRGADAYLAKPFHKEELQVQLQNLIALRQQLQERYNRLAQDLPLTNDPVLQQEDAFIKRVQNIIELHLSEDHFDVEQLSRLFHLHRSQFYRKVHALTGKDPSQLILETRIRKAKDLLLYHSEMNITEIALDLGFADSAHFSRTFKSVTGVSPSTYRKTRRPI